MADSKQSDSIFISETSKPDTYSVEVRARTSTQHRVTASAAYLRELGIGDSPPSRVLHEAFRFLLEREPNTAILTTFDLRDIARYFPEFPAEIARRLEGHE